MKTFFKIYDNFEEYLLATSIVVTVSVIFFQVFMRVLFSSLIVWSEELARFVFVWRVWLAVSLVTRRKGHLSINLLYNKVKGIPAIILKAIARLVTMLFCVFLVVTGWEVMMNMFGTGQTSPVLMLPLWILYLCIPFSFFITLIRLIHQSYEDIKEHLAKKPSDGDGDAAETLSEGGDA